MSELGRYPVAGSEEDAQKLITLTANINESLEDGKVEDIDPKLLRHFAFGARAVLNPMAAMFGGIVGQEVVKACSGKFHPLFQVGIMSLSYLSSLFPPSRYIFFPFLFFITCFMLCRHVCDFIYFSLLLLVN